jgi:hypothetical protein
VVLWEREGEPSFLCALPARTVCVRFLLGLVDLNNINTEGADREGVRAAVLFTGRSRGDVGYDRKSQNYLDGGT